MLPTKFWFIWPSVSEEKIFKNRPIRNKNCLWQPCLLMDRDEMSNLYRGPSIDASYQVPLHLAEGFQRRRLKCEKLTDDRRRTPSDGKSSHCLSQGELKLYIYIYICNAHLFGKFSRINWKKINYTFVIETKIDKLPVFILQFGLLASLNFHANIFFKWNALLYFVTFSLQPKICI
jgi:hypothetical protein